MCARERLYGSILRPAGQPVTGTTSSRVFTVRYVIKINKSWKLQLTLFVQPCSPNICAFIVIRELIMCTILILSLLPIQYCVLSLSKVLNDLKQNKTAMS